MAQVYEQTNLEGPNFEPPRQKGDNLNSRPRFHGNKYVDALPDIDQQLENAIIMGDLTWVKDCVKKGANVNCRLDEKGFTPLMLACEGGWANIVKYLVESGDIDLEAKDSGGYNAVDVAAMFGYYDMGVNGDVANIVDYLKSQGLAFTWGGAIIGYDLDQINEYLENGQDIEERIGYYCEGVYKFTGYQLACKYGRHALAKYFLTLGCVIPRDVCQLQIPFEHDVMGYT
jgi:ankyrin repeat protein